jgi:hypothetical protein
MKIISAVFLKYGKCITYSDYDFKTLSNVYYTPLFLLLLCPNKMLKKRMLCVHGRYQGFFSIACEVKTRKLTADFTFLQKNFNNELFV